MAKSFSIEDGNLQNKPITTTIDRINKDIDCSFTLNPTTGDIYKVTDANAVRQSVKNLLMTQKGTMPFRPYYGAGLEDLLFSLSTDLDEDDIEQRVRSAIDNYEPRAKLRDVRVAIRPDYNSADITIIFGVVNTTKIVTLGLTIARTR
jgi:phage baseplate assembly protein W